MNYLQQLDEVSELHFFQDKKIHFSTVICLHRNGRGPAIGGCRFIEYPSFGDAIDDAVRLSRAMSFKAAISELPHDGGKAVIIKPKSAHDREVFLTRFAECVESLKGKYITTIDSGTSQSDMSFIKSKMDYVTGHQDDRLEEYNVSASTALGVFEGIKAAVKLKYGTLSLSGLHVAVQGAGNVGYRLIKLLAQEGAKITVADIKHQDAERCAREFNAKLTTPDEIYSIDCDIFSPCALGKIINSHTLSQFKSHIIAGAANDQLISDEFADKLHAKNILYVPDYLINAGGLIHLSLQIQGQDKVAIDNAVKKISDRIITLKAKADLMGQSLFKTTHLSAIEAMTSTI